MSIKSSLMYSYIEAPIICECKDEARRCGMRGAGVRDVPAHQDPLLQAAQEKNEPNSYFATKENTQCPGKKIHQ